MIIYKTQAEIEIIAQGGKILAEILRTLSSQVKSGIGTKELNDQAEALIIKNGGRPAFKNYQVSKGDRPFPTTLCTSINEEIVHAPAEPNRILKEGDIIGLDIGMEYQGGFTDTAVTVAVGTISSEARKLLQVTKDSLSSGLAEFKAGNTLADVARAIQQHAEKNGCAVVRELVGHGVGKAVHEDPRVPNYVTEEAKLIVIKPGMVIAIEPMINLGGWQIELADDGFTFVTKDGSLSAQFEHTVALDHHNQVRIITAAK